MVNFIPTNKDAVKTWFANLASNIAISGSGVALLAVQIADLENRCRVMRSRINHNGRERTRQGEPSPMRVAEH
jgi:hypothetical protein